MCWFNDAQAQIKLDRFYPPVVASGTETIVVAEGKFPDWPSAYSCDRQEVKLTAEKEAGKFKVAVDANSVPGVAWVRFHDKTSASNLVPILIGQGSITNEVEPNNQNHEATKLTLPTTVTGKLHKGGEIDTFAISLKAGQQLVASLTAHQTLRSPMDGVLQLTDADGNVIRQSEDVRGLDPQIIHRVKSNQDLLLRLFAFPEVPTGTVGFAGSAAFVYTIDVTTGPFLDHVLIDDDDQPSGFGSNLSEESKLQVYPATELSPASAAASNALGWSWLPNLVPDDAHRISSGDTAKQLPAVAMGHITAKGQVDRFRFSAKKGRKYRIESWSKAAGFLLDSELKLIDPETDKQLAINDDQTRGQYDSVLEYTAKSDGELIVELRDLVDNWGPRHAYQLLLAESSPSANLSVAADHFVVEKDKPLEIDIAVNRDRGFDSKIRFSAADLPDGIQCDEVTVDAKAKSAKLKLVCKNDKPFQGAFRIEAQRLDKDDMPADTKLPVIYQLRPEVAVKKLWLTCQ
ncbi:serine protease [Planctomycetes bacterium K23_9]|uniref:serine protease n=1 Tax=Stieleria marina TaxID=1930275 RepID=UPI0011AA65D1